MAWITVALLDGYLASDQWSSAPSAGDLSGTLQIYAVVNLGWALVTILFAALLLTRPTRGRLAASIVWGALSVLVAIAQAVGAGLAAWAFVAVTLGAILAAAMSWAARSADTHPAR